MLIDSTNNKTVLDKKATVAVGNLLNEGKDYKLLFEEQKPLIDSLFKEIDYRKKVANYYEKEEVPRLERLGEEYQNENIHQQELFGAKENMYESRIKSLQSKKWNWLIYGLITGAAIMLGISL